MSNSFHAGCSARATEDAGRHRSSNQRPCTAGTVALLHLFICILQTLTWVPESTSWSRRPKLRTARNLLLYASFYLAPAQQNPLKRCDNSSNTYVVMFSHTRDIHTYIHTCVRIAVSVTISAQRQLPCHRRIQSDVSEPGCFHDTSCA